MSFIELTLITLQEKDEKWYLRIFTSYSYLLHATGEEGLDPGIWLELGGLAVLVDRVGLEKNLGREWRWDFRGQGLLGTLLNFGFVRILGFWGNCCGTWVRLPFLPRVRLLRVFDCF